MPEKFDERLRVRGTKTSGSQGLHGCDRDDELRPHDLHDPRRRNSQAYGTR
jgi:hypothetical protein